MPLPSSVLPTPTQAAASVPAREAAGCALPSSAGFPLDITKCFQVTREHAPADSGNGVVDRLRHSASDHLGHGGRNAVFMFGVDDPTVDASDDLVRPPAG